MSEHHHQAAVVSRCKFLEGRWPELEMLFAVPNGGRRDEVTGKKLKAEGVRPGVYDLCLPTRRGDCLSLWVEMKAPAEQGKKAGTESKAQKDWSAKMRLWGHRCVVCWGVDEAMGVILEYLTRPR